MDKTEDTFDFQVFPTICEIERKMMYSPGNTTYIGIVFILLQLNKFSPTV